MIDFQKSSFYSPKIAVLVCEVGLPKNFLVGNPITSLMVIGLPWRGNRITSLMVMVLPRRGNTITKPKKILVIPLPTAKVRK